MIFYTGFFFLQRVNAHSRSHKNNVNHTKSWNSTRKRKYSCVVCNCPFSVRRFVPQRQPDTRPMFDPRFNFSKTKNLNQSKSDGMSDSGPDSFYTIVQVQSRKQRASFKTRNTHTQFLGTVQTILELFFKKNLIPKIYQSTTTRVCCIIL